MDATSLPKERDFLEPQRGFVAGRREQSPPKLINAEAGARVANEEELWRSNDCSHQSLDKSLRESLSLATCFGFVEILRRQRLVFIDTEDVIRAGVNVEEISVTQNLIHLLQNGDVVDVERIR